MKVDFAKLDRAFNPECVVVVGDSKAGNFNWLRTQSTFKGKLYSVQVNPETIKDIEALGVKNYTSLLDIPEPVDLVNITVPRTVVPKVLEDCIRKEVAAVHLFTAGFAETNTEEGEKLDRLLLQKAEENNLHIIGPNCFGVFNPRLGVRQSEEQYADAVGSVGFIGQSGYFSLAFSMETHFQGVDINKSVSYGNGTVLDSADFLEYFALDPEIKVIGMYVEGVRDGKRFLRVLKEVAARKPVVVWKGGQTEESRRVIASHTASLSISQEIWDTAVRQCGAIQVTGMEELIDTLKALIYLPPVRGDRVAAAGGSGGQSVIITDIFTEIGLEVPELTQKSYDELATFFNLVGGGYSNPLDTTNPLNRKEMRRIMGILEQDANIDNLMLVVSTKPGRRFSQKEIENYIDLLDDVRRNTSKPVMALVYFSTPDATEITRDIILKFQERGIAAFPSIQRGGAALKNALDYHKLKNSINI